MVWRGGTDQVNAVVLKGLPHIGDQLRATSLFFSNRVTPFCADNFIDIHDDSNFRSFVTEVRANVFAAATVNTDHGHADLFVRRCPGPQDCRGREDG